ncbi:MAG: trypsin-like peptidase domain-containing protein [Actinobacteria bacterium]|nr:trypsin-like peptidase domain-containing protein [Actinomycetota bacterium]
MAKSSSRIGVFIAGMLVAVLVLVLLMVVGVLPVKTAQTTSAADAAGELTPLQIYQQEGAGVVEVLASFGGDGSGSPSAPSYPSGQGLGTGFLVSSDGYILTNDHVITNSGQVANAVVVVFKSRDASDADGTRVKATVIGGDAATDVALLKIDPSQAPVLHPLALADSTKVQVGEPVVAIGSPLGLSFSLSSGIVSATDRTLRSPTGAVISGGIQTDAAINTGNSGGPLIDSSGKVIGINTMIASSSGGSQGLGFAVPSNTALDVMDRLKTGGTAGDAYLGVSGQTLNADLASALGVSVSQGVLVADVASGSPAAMAGIIGGDRQIVIQGQTYLTGGDVIQAIDGEAVASAEDLVAVISRHKPGDTITLTVVRGGQTKQVPATLTERPSGA